MTRFAILGFGAIGLAVIARAALFYAKVDPIALGVCLAMAVVMIAGLVEVYRTASRIETLRAELAGFAKDATAESMERTSPVLRALLRARLERVALPVPTPVFAPYLTGLLVMLGLLGTFLGLFETLRGARIALAASADVDALRAGLERPMEGLMRSFGASAAGVSGSAMLGLASVFARRLANELTLELHACITGPLADAAPTARQLLALEALARQGEALPGAAKSLEGVVAEVQKLASSWQTAHRESAAEMQKTLGSTVTELRTSLERAAAASAEASQKAIQPIVAKGIEDTVAASTRQIDSVRKAIEADVAARRDSDQKALAAAEAHRKAVVEASEAHRKSVLEASEVHRKAVVDELAKVREAETKALETHLAKVLEELGKVREAQTGALATHLADVVARLDEAEGRRASTTDALLATLGESEKARLESVALALQSASAAFGDRLDAHVEKLHAQDAERDTALSGRWSELGAKVASELSEVVTRIEGAEAARREAVAAVASRLDAQAAEQAARFAREIEGLLGKWSEITATFEELSRTSAARDAERAGQLASIATQVQADLGAAAEAVRAQVEKSTEQDRAEQERVDALFTRLAAASDEVSRAAKEQSDALARFVDAAGTRMQDAEQKSDERLSGFLSKIDAAIETQAMRLAEVAELVRSGQKDTATAFAEQLAAHAKVLGDGLAETTAIVREAAGLVHAGGAELSSVAEAFAEATSRQERAAEEWLANLGKVEAAVAEAGESAAADVLGQHLAHTHELFDRQLRFQNELYEQLRSMRRGAEAGSTGGEPTADTDAGASASADATEANAPSEGAETGEPSAEVDPDAEEVSDGPR
ncbi:MAG: hypothetical protein U0230_01280 [Polyangiales bacterium]